MRHVSTHMYYTAVLCRFFIYSNGIFICDQSSYAFCTRVVFYKYQFITMKYTLISSMVMVVHA